MSLNRGFYHLHHSLSRQVDSKLLKFSIPQLIPLSSKRISTKHVTEDATAAYHKSFLQQQKIPPFVKNLFLGEFNKSLLSYAEILNDESYLELEVKIKQVREYLDRNTELVKQIDKTSKIHPDLLQGFKNSGLYGLSVPEKYGGAELYFTEIGRFYEELGDSLALSEVLAASEGLGVSSLLAAASQEIKERYLGKVARGEAGVAWCLAEKRAASDPGGVEAKAEDGGDYWELTGTKTWVTDANNCQLFLVFARTKSSDSDGDNITCFLVDRAETDSETMKFSPPHNLAGYRGLEPCDIEFSKCKIPKHAVIGGVGEGLNLVQTVMNQNKFLHTFAVIKYLKNLFNETVEHCSKKEQFGQKLSEFALVRTQLAKMASKLYALESTAYMTAGLADASIDGDIEVESVITRQLASDTADFVVNNCLQLLGSSVHHESSKYQQYLRDSTVLSWQGNTNINKCFVAMSCLMHLIQHKPDLADLRQPANGNVLKSLKFQFNAAKHHMNRVVLTKNLYKNFGAGLQTSGRRLEWCAHKLPHVAENLLVHRGANLQLEEAYLARIHDLAAEVYVMTAVLSRASRSLTLGLDSHEMEGVMAVSMSFESKQRVKQLCVETVDCHRDESNRDELHEHAADYICRRGGYVAVHPLTKNSF